MYVQVAYVYINIHAHIWRKYVEVSTKMFTYNKMHNCSVKSNFTDFYIKELQPIIFKVTGHY